MARQQPPSRRPTDIVEVCRTALRLVDYGLNADGITVRIDADKKVPMVNGDPDQLHQVFANLLVNAQQVLRARSGRRQIRIAVQRSQAGGCAVTFDDTGSGVPEELRERIFDPFFTTKQVGHGTGVGLAVCRSIITAHGGSIVCAASPLGGARFVIELAAAAPAEAKMAAADAPVGRKATRRRALVVDDEVEIAMLLTEIAEAAGWQVDRADGGRSAIQRLKRYHYDLMFADLRMPGVDGRGLAEWVAAHRPALKDAMYFVTGDVLANDGAAIPAERLLEKPFDPAAVRRILAMHAGGSERLERN
jgi:CheY-like chemotaxis protein